MLTCLDWLTPTLLPARARKYPYAPAVGLCPFWYYATSRGRFRRLRVARLVTILANLN